MRVQVEIDSPLRPDDVVVVESALIDTGASRTTVPRDIANRLELVIRGQDQIRTAAGIQSIDRSFALTRLNGRETISDVWISDTYPGVLIGLLTLESLELAVDPGLGELTTSEFLLL